MCSHDRLDQAIPGLRITESREGLLARHRIIPSVAELVISPGTVKKHIETVKTKLGGHRRTELAALYLRFDGSEQHPRTPE